MKLIREKKFNQLMYVPCGKCVECRKKRARDWQFRLFAETKYSQSVYFVTLTYDEENLPTLPNGQPCYDNSHICNFHKSLRHKVNPFRFIMVGEYGKETQRPHYHAIYFFAKLQDSAQFDSEVRQTWKYGDIIDIQQPRSIGAVTGYCTKYILKEDLDYDACIVGRRTDKFRLHCSKSLGVRYLREFDARYWYDNRGEVKVGSEQSGKIKAVTMPRYYRKLLVPQPWDFTRAHNIVLEQHKQMSLRMRDEFNDYCQSVPNATFEYWYEFIWLNKDKIENDKYESYLRLKTNKC